MIRNMAKTFRIVETDEKVMRFRIDQLHTILFIKYWDNGSQDLSPYYRWPDLDKAVLYIKEKYPNATIYLKVPDKYK